MEDLPKRMPLLMAEVAKRFDVVGVYRITTIFKGVNVVELKISLT